MVTIIFVFVAGWLGGMGLAYIMFADITQAERRRYGYPALRDEQPPIPICHPDRRNTLTGAYQEQMAMDEGLVAELNSEIDELERDAHEYRQEIRRLRDEIAELRFPVSPVDTPSRYNVVDRFAYLEVSE